MDRFASQVGRALAALLAAAFIVGCSGDGDSSSVTLAAAGDPTTTVATTITEATTTTAAPPPEPSTTTAAPTTAPTPTAAPTVPPESPDAALAFFRSTEAMCRSHAQQFGNPEVPAQYFSGASPVEPRGGGRWLIRDGGGTLLVVDPNARVVHPADGPEGLLRHEYSFGCSEQLYLGSTGD